MSNIQINSYNFAAAGGLGAWKELDRTTIGSAVSDFSVGSLPNMRYYMVLTNILGKNNSGVNWQMRMGNTTIDTGNNYAFRYSLDGGAEATGTNQDQIQNGTNPTGLPQFNVAYISNLSAQDKLMTTHDINQNTAGAGTAPQRGVYVGKWANTSNPISIIGATTGSGSYTFDTGSEMVVLGYDPTDTHTTSDNFWQELASVELGVTADELSSGTISAKKYLMVEYYVKKTGTANTRWRFNNDTTSSYAARQSGNGGADGTLINQTSIYTHADTSGNAYGKIFIVNNSANEKLGIFDEISQGAATAGTAPARREVVGKWTNTSSQITEIDLLNTDTGGFESGTLMKVWGSD